MLFNVVDFVAYLTCVSIFDEIFNIFYSMINVENLLKIS